MKKLHVELARAGIGSRRKADRAICEGRVRVNGKVVREPWHRVDPDVDTIEVDGKPVSALPSFSYYMLNKPIGYLCSNRREGKSPLVIDLFDGDVRLFTVGRLDKATSGLILVTNDGDFANKVMHPSSEVVKEYIVKVDRPISHDDLVTMGKGVHVDGNALVPRTVSKVRRNTVKITLCEGKKHEVRHIVKGARLSILSLTRVRIGQLRLGSLPVGAYRPLTERERLAIFA
jgi:23S rRNA pseudouridine2605 synthase